MTTLRPFTSEELQFCTCLGMVVVAWNHAKSSMRRLVQRSVRIGDSGERIMILVANLGNVSLSEALSAIADDHRDEIKAHLKHCAVLFDAERIYRNYYVHSPVTFATTEDESFSKGVAHQISAKGGALRSHTGFVTADDLVAFKDRIASLQNYLSALLSNSMTLQPPLSSLQMPPLPAKLELPRRNLIEPKPQPQSSPE